MELNTLQRYFIASKTHEKEVLKYQAQKFQLLRLENKSESFVLKIRREMFRHKSHIKILREQQEENESTISHLFEKAKKLRMSFIQQEIAKGTKRKEIGKILGVSAGQIHNWNLYKGNPINSNKLSTIRSLWNNSCSLCKKRYKKFVSIIHIHHIGKSEDSSISNLIPVCPKCHIYLHKFKGKDKKKYKSLILKAFASRINN